MLEILSANHKNLVEATARLTASDGSSDGRLERRVRGGLLAGLSLVRCM